RREQGLRPTKRYSPASPPDFLARPRRRAREGGKSAPGIPRSPPEGNHLMKRASIRISLAAVAVAALGAFFTPARALPAPAPGEDGWVSLFNGKDLEGWVQRGGKAKYRAEAGEIVGTSVPKTSNSFLCTKRDYADFILELEFKVDPDLNSGVQVR